MSGDEAVSSSAFRYENCTVSRIPAVQALHNVVFPIRYPAADYARAIESNASLSWLAYDGESLVGALVCRAEDNRVYILTLAVVATYRELGIGTKLLELGTGAAKENSSKFIYAHVQQGNTDALNLYRKFGFSEKETVRNYYRRLKPPHAIVVEKRLRTND